MSYHYNCTYCHRFVKLGTYLFLNKRPKLKMVETAFCVQDTVKIYRYRIETHHDTNKCIETLKENLMNDSYNTILERGPYWFTSTFGRRVCSTLTSIRDTIQAFHRVVAK